jgi:hypothetical protein
MIISLKRWKRIMQDYQDMKNACQTAFYRCKCGRLREYGIMCPNEKCGADYQK